MDKERKMRAAVCKLLRVEDCPAALKCKLAEIKYAPMDDERRAAVMELLEQLARED